MTTIITDITALRLVDVVDRGVPNKERIAIVAEEFTSLGSYGLMIGVGQANHSAVPLKDNLLWFGNGYLRKGDWLFVYTGPGEARLDPLDANTSLISVFWGRDRTVFYSPDLVPILFKMSEVAVLPASRPQSLPQVNAMKGPVSAIADAMVTKTP